ncbi:energy-coupling factor ABC transporter ATP-binding protein [Cytobacillus sp. FJAT-54145]|uniref:Energy-coupling factor ABC transporter ATP-binding protein n=1 Tax=Cytobacillus spartinae TaxID=3299023 RepID=A0ABW6K6N7_9BACI
MSKIRVENLSFKYLSSKKWALDTLSFEIDKGELIAIIGANGSGKTSLCNAIRGFIPHFYKGVYSGDVYINGENILNNSLGKLALDVGYVFQNPFTQMSGVGETVYQELCFGLENIGLSKNKIHSRIEEIVELTKINKLINKNPFELSGGQQQRVALASILVMNPDILIIDEPTSQLDPQSSEEIFKIIYELKQQGKTIILVEHKMEHIAEYADRVFLLNEGRIVLTGSIDQIFSNPSLGNYNVSTSQYAYFFQALKERGKNIPYIPVNEEDSTRLLTSLLLKSEEGL